MEKEKGLSPPVPQSETPVCDQLPPGGCIPQVQGQPPEKPPLPAVCWMPPTRGGRSGGVTVFKPAVRCSMEMIGGMTASKIKIRGSAVTTKGFTVALQAGTSGEDVSLHLQAHFDKKVVICNACQSKVWGEQEKVDKFPFQENQTFEMSIEPTSKEYRIRVNDEEFYSFSYRMVPFQRFQTLKVDGDVNVSQISLD